MRFAQFSRCRVEPSQVRSTPSRYRFRSGLRFYRTSGEVRNTGLITQKTLIQRALRHSFQDVELKLQRYLSTTPRKKSSRGWRFYRTSNRVGNKVVNHSKIVIQSAFTQFSRYRVETSQVSQRLNVKVAKRFTVLLYPGGVRNEGLITQKT